MHTLRGFTLGRNLRARPSTTARATLRHRSRQSFPAPRRERRGWPQAVRVRPRSSRSCQRWRRSSWASRTPTDRDRSSSGLLGSQR
eukprot:2957123-Prymnesium_polylepis.2